MNELQKFMITNIVEKSRKMMYNILKIIFQEKMLCLEISQEISET